MTEVPVITIDGPGGSGKGTIAQRVAEILGWHYLDSGAIYRVLAWLAKKKEVVLDDVDALVALASSMDIEFTGGSVQECGVEIGSQIRNESVARDASIIAVLVEVREVLSDWQRSCARTPGLVAEGRDMGTVVFPGAMCKIFLTASAEKRAQRRFKQLREKGFNVTLDRLYEEINERDERDSRRKISPLLPAADAVMLDTSDLDVEQVVERVLQQIDKQAGNRDLKSETQNLGN